MIEKLLALFFHAKSSAISGVLLIGASGALVTATTQDGVTTITVTQASPSPSASASPRPSAPAAAPAAATAAPDDKACVGAMQKVNAAFSERHATLSKLQRSAKTRAAKDALHGADELLKAIRKAAGTALRALDTCARTELGEEAKERTSSLQGLVLTGDPAAIATEAVAAMDLVLNDLRNRFPELAVQAAGTPRPTRSPKPAAANEDSKSRDGGKKDKKGKGASDASGGDDSHD